MRIPWLRTLPPRLVIILVVLALVAIFSAIRWATRPVWEDVEINGVRYRWPKEQTVVVRPPLNSSQTYVRYSSNFILIYDGMHQNAPKTGDLPYLQLTTRPGLSKPEEFNFVQTSGGTVLCDKKAIEVGLTYQCGMSFLHRGARWQLVFQAQQLTEAESLWREAISTLDRFAAGE
jgi:hypothetical protein